MSELPEHRQRTALGPIARPTAWRALAHSVAETMPMLTHRSIHQPKANVGRTVQFGDGTQARVYRETTVDRPPSHPCVLAVSFRLRLVRGDTAHALFRMESILNTPLFVGFPGFVSKLWFAHDRNAVYRGLYEWDGPDRAGSYARSLWRVLELVSVNGSIDYRVLPGLRRDDVLADPSLLDGYAISETQSWWRVVAAA
jgi:hypothetical protein